MKKVKLVNMAKCGNCGKFLATKDGVRCCTCANYFHLQCVSLPASTLASDWKCSKCAVHTSQGDNWSTPKNVPSPASQRERQTSPLSSTLTDTDNTTLAELKVDLALEIRSFRHELCEMRAEIRQWRKEIADLKSTQLQNNDRITSMEVRLTALENRSDESKQDTSPVDNIISELRKELNERDQQLLSNDLVLAGITEQSDESLSHTAKIIALKLGIELDERDIVHVERIGSTRRNRQQPNNDIATDPIPQQPRIIAVRLARRAARDNILRAARVRRVLTTTDIEMRGPPRRIFVNERLTRTNQYLLQRTREVGRQQSWKYIWSKDGRIFARKADGKLAERISSEQDIKRVFGLCSV